MANVSWEWEITEVSVDLYKNVVNATLVLGHLL